MKKFRFITASAAAAALMLTACQNQEDFGQEEYLSSAEALNDPNAIQFGTYLGKSLKDTRAGATGVITTEKLKAIEGFGVLGYNTGATDWKDVTAPKPNFMYNQQVAWDGQNWSYSPVKFWPNDYAGDGGYVDKEINGNQATGGNNSPAKLSFFAYAPYVELASYDPRDKEDYFRNAADDTPVFETNEQEQGIVAMTYNEYEKTPSVKYILKEAASTEAVDLLWGKRGNSSGYDLANGSTEASIGEYNTDLTKQTVSEKVNFLFKHALAKIAGNTSKDGNEYGTGAQSGLYVVLDIDKDGDITGGAKENATLVTVNDVRIQDIRTAGITELDPDGDGTDDITGIVTSGWFDFATGKWDNVKMDLNNDGSEDENWGATYESGETTPTSEGAQGQLDKSIAEFTPDPDETTMDKWVNTDGETVEGVTTKIKSVYSEDSDVPAIFMIPSSADQTFVVTITYTVRTFDSHLSTSAAGENGTWTKVTQKIKNRVTIPGNSLEVNKYYKLIMHLGLTSVKFTAEVADWDSAEGTDSDNDGSVDSRDADADKDIYLPSNVLSVEGVYDVENADATAKWVNNNYVTASANASAKAGTFTIGLTGVPAASGAKNASDNTGYDLSIKSFASGVTNATLVNGIISVELPENSTTSIKEYTVTVLYTDKNTTEESECEITINQDPYPFNFAVNSVTNTSVEFSSVKLGTNDYSGAIYFEDAYNIAGAYTPGTKTLALEANETTRNRTLVLNAAQDDATGTVSVIQPAGDISLPTSDYTAYEADGTEYTFVLASSKLDATKAIQRTLLFTVENAEGRPENLKVAGTSLTVTVKEGSNNVTSQCTITREPEQGVIKIVFPVNNAATEKTYNISIKVNDSPESTIEGVKQSGKTA